MNEFIWFDCTGDIMHDANYVQIYKGGEIIQDSSNNFYEFIEPGFLKKLDRMPGDLREYTEGKGVIIPKKSEDEFYYSDDFGEYYAKIIDDEIWLIRMYTIFCMPDYYHDVYYLNFLDGSNFIFFKRLTSESVIPMEKISGQYFPKKEGKVAKPSE